MVRIPIFNNETDEVKEETSDDVETETTETENDELTALENELAETKTLLLQLAADFENYKRQAARRETETRDRAERRFAEDLLPILDNFERAVDASKNSTDVTSLRVGVEFILQMFQQALSNHGVVPIEAKGQAFDPLKHEAIAQVESEEAPGTVVAEAQRGYTYKDQVMRAAMVTVAS